MVGVSASSLIRASTSINYKYVVDVANLLLCGVDRAVVKPLKKQAGAHGHCPETEHRSILAAASLTPRRRPLAELLAAMPDVGRDADFERRDHGGVAADFLELVLAELAAD